MKIPEHYQYDYRRPANRNLTSEDSRPSGCKAQKAVIAFWGDGGDPVVHSTLGWICRHEFGEGGTDEGLENPNQDEAVDHCHSVNW